MEKNYGRIYQTGRKLSFAGETMKHIEEVCRAQKYDSIRLDCFTQNPYSRRLYDKCGYTVTGYADWRKGRFELREKKL